MDVTQLMYFRTVAETGSFTRAAESLHMTQSALSKSIARLEDEVGLRFFEREGNRISLNRFGQRFLLDTEPILRQFGDCVRAVREMAGLEQGDVRIAISKDSFIDHIIRQFLLDYPDVSFHSYLLSPEQAIDALEKGTVDLAVTTDQLVGTGIQWQGLYQDQLEVLLSADHPLAGTSELRLSQLQHERFIVTNSNYNIDNVIRRLCVLSGFEPKIMYEGTSTDMPMHFIAIGKAVMITPRSISLGVREMLNDSPEGARVLRIPLRNEFPEMQKTLGVAFKEGHYQSQAAQAFYERMLAFYTQINK